MYRGRNDIYLCLLNMVASSYRPCLGTRFSFPNLSLGEFGAQNKVTETRPCLGTKIEFEKLGFGGSPNLMELGFVKLQFEWSF